LSKKYVLIAGVNGAGKSTLFSSIDSLKNMERINIDEIVREFGSWRNPSDVMKAGKIAIDKLELFFDKGISFNQETTLCGKSIISNIKKAKSLGYEIEMHYVGVNSVEIAKERIAYRVKHKGHGIPDSDVERRYIESFNRLKEVKDICDYIVLYDNTIAFNRFAVIKGGKFCLIAEDAPYWYIKELNIFCQLNLKYNHITILEQ